MPPVLRTTVLVAVLAAPAAVVSGVGALGDVDTGDIVEMLSAVVDGRPRRVRARRAPSAPAVARS